MLIFIGLGLHNERDITLRGLDEARGCDVLFAEFYTSVMSGLNIEKLQSLVEKKIVLLERKDLEENAQKILDAAKTKKICILVAGDPLISTTHAALRIEAKKQGIETRIVHNASIFSVAPSISGLQNYKFGRSATIAAPERGFFPETPYEVIKENKNRGLHTLLFLDIKMNVNEAIKFLLEVENKRKEKVFTDETLCVVIGNAGSQDSIIKAGKVKELKNQNFGAVPHILITPGELHFMEEEYLKEFAGLKNYAPSHI